MSNQVFERQGFVKRMGAANVFVYALAIVFSAVMIAGAGYAAHMTSVMKAQGAVVLVSQPVTAKSVCVQAHGTHFKDNFTKGGWPTVTDEGNCTIAGKSYGVDVFTSNAARKAWLKVSEPFGVVPKWETDDAVIYPSVN